MIELGKKYRTRAGLNWRTLCIDLTGEFPVAGAVTYDDGTESLFRLRSNGMFLSTGKEHPFDLIEVSPYEDWPIDAPVWVRMWALIRESRWVPRHFAGVDGEGRAITFIDGLTSHSSRGKTTYWEECRLASEFTPTAEERGE